MHVLCVCLWGVDCLILKVQAVGYNVWRGISHDMQCVGSDCGMCAQIPWYSNNFKPLKLSTSADVHGSRAPNKLPLTWALWYAVQIPLSHHLVSINNVPSLDKA